MYHCPVFVKFDIYTFYIGRRHAWGDHKAEYVRISGIQTHEANEMHTTFAHRQHRLDILLKSKNPMFSYSLSTPGLHFEDYSKK